MEESKVQKLIAASEEFPFGFMVIRPINENAQIIAINDHIYELCGDRSKKAFFDRTEGKLRRLIHPDDFRAYLSEVLDDRRSSSQAHKHIFYRMTKADGSYINVEDNGRIIDDARYGRVLVLFVTMMNEAVNRNVFDQVTGLHERAYLINWLNRQRKYNPGYFKFDNLYVVAFNLAGFKNLNESSGFQEGNQFLKNFAQILLDVFETDVIERIYADHFAVFYDGTDVVDKIRLVRKAMSHIQHSVPMRLEAGIYKWTNDDHSLDEGVEKAESACKFVHGKTEQYYAFYSHDLAANLKLKLYVQSHIDEAIEKRWIEVYLQPVVRTLTGKVCGFEALSRWNDPTYGMISPGAFVPALEEKYLSYKLAEFVIDETARIIARQEQRYGQKSVPVSLNLSRRDFNFIDPAKCLEEAIGKYHIDQNQICVEITESTAMENPDQVKNIISQLHDIHYSVWMDDFGSSYSSLNALKDFDFDEIKLDMAFMRGLNDKGKIIVESCVNMAKKLGVQTLCEGVETADQFNFLKEIGCEKIQGYYFSKPLPMHAIDDYLSEKHLNIESNAERKLYNGITSFRFDSSHAWFLSLYHEGDVHILFRNRKLLAGAKKCGVSEDFKLDDLSAQGSNISPKLYKSIEKAIDSHQPEEVTYFANGVCYLIQSQVLSSDGKYCITLTGLRNVTGELGIFSLASSNPIIQSILAMYDCIYQLDYEKEKVEVITSDFVQQNVGTVYDLDVSEIKKQFVGHDRERFGEWISKKRVIEYFSNSQHVYDSGIFTIHTRRGNIIKDFILLRINGNEKGRYLLVMRDIHLGRQNVEEPIDYSFTNEGQSQNSQFQNGIRNLRPYTYAEQVYEISDSMKSEILYGLTSIFVAVLEVDVASWQVVPVVLPNVVKSYMSEELLDYRQTIIHYCSYSVSASYQQQVLSFLNPDTIVDRLTREGVLAKTYVGKTLGWIRIAVVPSKRDENGRVTRFLFTCRDVNKENNEKQYMNYLIEHDSLTKLFNRSAFQRLSAQLKRSSEAIGLMMIDIDGFKTYNDTYGHEMGDTILREVAKVLENSFRASDYVIRMGGDEFAVILVDCPQNKASKALVYKITNINHILNHPADGLPVVSISAGLAISPKGYEDELYHQADVALYKAKAKGKNKCMIYDEKT